MKRKISALSSLLVLLVLILSSTVVTASADTFISLWSSQNLRKDLWDITQYTSYSSSSGFTRPQYVI
ncbi:MAG: hypothetical protein IJ800_01740 [Clostridia bacterium]|nr:hypothetical protein [Clostridia bacterium]